MTYNLISTSKLKILAEEAIKSFVPDVKSLYGTLDEEHLQIKIYQSLDRVKMFTATQITGDTFYGFDIKSLTRKQLINIIETLHSIDYNTIHSLWHSELKELFYQQKEQKKLEERLSHVCVLCRVENSFLRVVGDTAKQVQLISEATEFTTNSLEPLQLEEIKNFIFEKFGLKAHVFFNSKVTGRNKYNGLISFKS